MAFSPLVRHFGDDLEHLIWRSEVHHFSSTEIYHHFQVMQNTYSSLVQQEAEEHELQCAIRHGLKVIEKIVQRHQYFLNSKLTPELSTTHPTI